MLNYLLDENISHVVAEQLLLKNPLMQVHSIHRWKNKAFVGNADERLLRVAQSEGLTLVTFDLRTIPTLLSELAADGVFHGGVLFVDDASIRNNDYGGLVNSLLAHWQRYCGEEWGNRVAFLEAFREASPHNATPR